MGEDTQDYLLGHFSRLWRDCTQFRYATQHCVLGYSHPSCSYGFRYDTDSFGTKFASRALTQTLQPLRYVFWGMPEEIAHLSQPVQPGASSLASFSMCSSSSMTEQGVSPHLSACENV